MHYTLDPDMTYASMLNEVRDNAFNREKLQAAFNRIQESDELFNGLFADVDLYSNRLGTGDQKQSATIAEVPANMFSKGNNYWKGYNHWQICNR